MIEKSISSYTQLQQEINGDEASIFGNKKYKELIKIAAQQQSNVLDQIDEQFPLGNIIVKDGGVQSAYDNSIFAAYTQKLIGLFEQNNGIESELAQKAAEQKKAEEEEAKQAEDQPDDNKKKQQKKKKGKEIDTKIGFGKGTRAFFDFL